MLQGLVVRTVKTIRKGKRTDGNPAPIQAHTAARQVLSNYTLSGLAFIQLWMEVIKMQQKSPGGVDFQKLARTPLTDLVGEAAKRRMRPGEYDNLLYIRNEDLSPSAAANAE